LFRLRRSTISEWFENESNFWKLFTCLLAVLAVLKGVRRPGLWALTHAELDYSFGFVKRGLLGTFYHEIHLWHWHPLWAMFVTETAVLLFLITLMTLRSGLLSQRGGWYIAAAFASSYCVTFLVHLIGYTDIPLAALTVGLLLIRDSRLRFLSGLPIIPVAILIHENYLLLFIPVILFSFFLDGVEESKEVRRKAWTRGLVLCALAVVMALVTSLKPSLSLDQVRLMQTRMSSKVDFPLRSDVFDVLTFSLRHNLSLMWHMYAHSYWWWAEQFLSLCVFGPVLFLLIRRCFRTLESVDRSVSYIRAAVLIATFAPLAMHLLGWDQVRWNTICVLDGYLSLLLINMRFRAARIAVDNAERNFVILVIALNLTSGYGLTDFIAIKSYPFFPPAIKGIVARHDGIVAPL
jgi:hypothetical protein